MNRMFLPAVITIAILAVPAWAQDPSTDQKAPNMPNAKDVPAERISPKDPLATGSTDNLSQQLEKSDGVIRPPATETPDMTVPAPVPNPGTMPVIPPPGSPGGDQQIVPK